MNPETHTPLRTNKQTNDFDMHMYPRALRCLALDLKDYAIFSLSDWLRFGLVEQLFGYLPKQKSSLLYDSLE